MQGSRNRGGRSRNIQNNIINIDDISDTGYSLVVDLKIPKQLHDTFNEYAPAPEHVSPQYDLSDYHKTMVDEGLGPKPPNNTKTDVHII
jgi:hypothetical protein